MLLGQDDAVGGLWLIHIEYNGRVPNVSYITTFYGLLYNILIRHFPKQMAQTV